MLEITELCYVMPKGTTEPINCRLSNGIEAVVKYPNNQCGTATLINEWIGYSLSRKIGITTPEYGLCNLDTNIVHSNMDINILDESNSGTCFYSRFISKAIPLVARPHVINHETERIIMIDFILNNCDRHKGNLFYELNTSTLYTIDYSHLFTGEARADLSQNYLEQNMRTDSFLNTDLLDKNKPAYELLCYAAGYDDKTVLIEAERIRTLITHEFLMDVFSELPDEWTQAVKGDIIKNLIDFIEIRVSNLDRMAHIIINWGR